MIMKIVDVFPKNQLDEEACDHEGEEVTPNYIRQTPLIRLPIFSTAWYESR